MYKSWSEYSSVRESWEEQSPEMGQKPLQPSGGVLSPRVVVAPLLRSLRCSCELGMAHTLESWGNHH